MKNALNLGKSFDFYAVLNLAFDGAIVFCDHKEPGSSPFSDVIEGSRHLSLISWV